MCGVLSTRLDQRAKLFRRSESVCRCFAFISSVSTSSPAAAISGMLRARAWLWMSWIVEAPRPRFGVLTIRSKARSSAGFTVARR